MNLFLTSLILSVAFFTLSSADKYDQKEHEADRKCFNKVMLDQGMKDQVHIDGENKFLFVGSCRKFRIEQFMNPTEASRRVIEIFTQDYLRK